MLWPNGTTSQPRVSSGFGPRPAGAFSFHYGVDFVGYSTVRAAGGGQVTFAGWMNNAAGNTVVISYGGGVTEVHMHLATFAVSRGVYVSPGSTIGRMGMTGNASGNCDHFEIRVNGTSVDPIAYIAARIASGGGSQSEEDDMTPEQSNQLNAVYAALFGPANVGAEKTTWKKPFGETGGEAYYGMFDVLIASQQTLALNAGKLAALEAAVGQLSAGSGVALDMRAIEDAAERGAKDALADLTLVSKAD